MRCVFDSRAFCVEALPPEGLDADPAAPGGAHGGGAVCGDGSTHVTFFPRHFFLFFLLQVSGVPPTHAREPQSSSLSPTQAPTQYNSPFGHTHLPP